MRSILFRVFPFFFILILLGALSWSHAKALGSIEDSDSSLGLAVLYSFDALLWGFMIAGLMLAAIIRWGIFCGKLWDSLGETIAPIPLGKAKAIFVKNSINWINVDTKRLTKKRIG